jgi:2-polyprenyl-6-hydroxyphenyl methylase/3-demethylubiquinone-9 3-methyltransferase
VNNDRIGELVDGAVGTRAARLAARQRLRWMCRQAGGDPVLDLGCSQGVATILLAREGRNVVGVDRETGAIESARERLAAEPEPVRARVRFELAEAVDLKFAAGSFETVLLGEVLEHQVSPAELVAAADRVLAPDGTAVVTVPYGLFRYHDHKASIYLGPLLDLLCEVWQPTALTLISRYACVALRKPAPGATSRPIPWREALALADERVAAHDATIDEQGRQLIRLRSEVDALQAERGEQTRLQAELEAQRTRVAALEQELDALRNVERRLRGELEIERLGHVRALAERDEAQRLADALRDL